MDPTYIHSIYADKLKFILDYCHPRSPEQLFGLNPVHIRKMKTTGVSSISPVFIKLVDLAMAKLADTSHEDCSIFLPRGLLPKFRYARMSKDGSWSAYMTRTFPHPDQKYPLLWRPTPEEDPSAAVNLSNLFNIPRQKGDWMLATYSRQYPSLLWKKTYPAFIEDEHTIVKLPNPQDLPPSTHTRIRLKEADYDPKTP